MTRITQYLREAMCQWRHDIHRHPELGFDEHRTAEKVTELLQSWDIETHAGIGGTGVVGVIKRGNSKRMLGMRADMDALAILSKIPSIILPEPTFGSGWWKQGYGLLK